MSKPVEIKSDARDERLSGPQRVKHREHEHVRKLMLAEARERCHETRDAYVACVRGAPLRRLVSARAA